ncbi:MAG: gabT1 [Clostridiales bacterium]|jgi:acetylornithine aminotransferase|nr:gabT1 [Clostridiales bacterium]
MDTTINERRLKMFASPGVTLSVLNASGTRINTQEYGELIDFESGCWAAILGHSRSEIVQAITNNVGLLFHTHQFFDTNHPDSLVKELCNASNLSCNYKGTFLSSGSEAVSLAIMLAELITGRKRKLSFSISYLGASSDLRIPRNPEIWTDLDISDCIHCKKCLTCKECLKFEEIDFSQFAAFVFEPGNSGGLVLFAPEKLVSYLATEIRSSRGFFIASEITTGFGRTGQWFGFQHYNFFQSKTNLPDFISLGKGLGNGYPISGLLVKPDLAQFIESTGFRYVQSHSDDPLGCIITRKVIEIMVRENLIEKGNKSGEYLRRKLIEIGDQTGGIVEVRGRGMMNIAVLDKHYKAKKVFESLLKRKCFIGYSEMHNVIRFYAPLTISIEEIDVLCSSLKLILAEHVGSVIY